MRFMSGVIGDEAGVPPSGIVGSIGVRSDVANFVPAIIGEASIAPAIVAYSGVTALSPVLSEPDDAVVSPGLVSYSGITPFLPTLSDPSTDFNILDDWVDQGTSVSIGSPGSRSFTEAPNRLLIVHATNTGATAADLIGLSYGGQAMTLVQDAASVSGRDMDSSIWILDQAGLTAAVGTAFVANPASGAVQFRLRSAIYKNVDQADPIVSSVSIQSVAAGDDPIPVASSTVSDSVIIAALSINAGAGDDGVEDVAYSNMNERVQDDASSSQYASIAVQATTGGSFTPILTTTQTARITHLLQVALRSSTGSPNGVLVPGLGAYSGVTALLPVMSLPASGDIIAPLGAYSGVTSINPRVDDISIQAPLGAYSGASNPLPVIADITITAALGSYSGVTALLPIVANEFQPTELSDLELWFDADDASTITETSGNVSLWDDLSTESNDLDQGTGSRQPDVSTVNGNASLFFNGSDDHIDTTSASVTGEPFTLAVVYTPTSVTGDNSQMFSTRDGSFGDVIRAGRDADDLSVTIGTGAPPGSLELTVANSLAVGETRWFIVRCGQAVASDLLTDEGDTDSGTGPTTIAVQTRVSIGGRDNASQDWTGHVHEVIYYNQFLSNGDRDKIKDYLNDRWTMS